MRDAVIVSAVRTAVGKAPKGTLRSTRPDDMAAAVIKAAVERAPGLDVAEIDDVILGCAMPEAEQGMNVARIAAHVRSTHGPGVLGSFGAFAGLFHLTSVQDPVLVASTDGVGTKLLLAAELGAYDVLGRDLVNLSVNDVLTSGATTDACARALLRARAASVGFSDE